MQLKSGSKEASADAVAKQKIKVLLVLTLKTFKEY